MTPKKVFVDPVELLHASFALARKVFDSGYRPDLVLGLWRGGAPVALAIHEFFAFKGVEADHAVLKVSSYRGIENPGLPRVENLDAMLAKLDGGTRVLVVDDIFDTGATIKEVHACLHPCTAEIRVATVFFKPLKNTTDLVPDFWVTQTEDWIVFPHELLGLSREELKAKGTMFEQLLD